MVHTTTFRLWTSMPTHRSYTMFMVFLQGERKSFPGGRRDTKHGSKFPLRASLAGATDGGACVASRSHCWAGSQHECQADLWHRSTSYYSILFHARWCALAHGALLANAITSWLLSLQM